MFDADGCLRKFERVEEILEDFVRVRRRKYHDRKKFLEGMLQAQSLRLSNQVGSGKDTVIREEMPCRRDLSSRRSREISSWRIRRRP